MLYAFETTQTILTGCWFQDDLESAYAKPSPNVPERHNIETRALAVSLEIDPNLIEVLNVFPEHFHCSGFAVFGKATKDGTLYHGRLFDSLSALSADELNRTVTIRGEPHSVFLAIQRSLAHTAYHIGQIILIARILAADQWSTITIPRGGSSNFNDRVWGAGYYQTKPLGDDKQQPE